MEHSYLLGSEKVGEDDKRAFVELKGQTEGRKKIKEIVIVVLFLIFGLSVYRIKVVDTRYPQAKTVRKEMGEEGMIGKNIQFSVLSSEWMNREEMIEKYGEALDFYDKYDYLGLLVHVNVKNLKMISFILSVKGIRSKHIGL